MTSPERGPATAPAWHTLVFLLAVTLVAVREALRSPIYEWPVTLAAPHARLTLYLEVLALQVFWVGFVWLGVRRVTSLRALVDRSPWSPRGWLRYLGIGLAGWIVYLALGALLSTLLRPSADALRGLQAMLPHSRAEKVLWVAFALAAGVGEEIVYRGYLLRQFRSFTGSAALAVILQALFYTSIHLILPAWMLPGILLLGLLLGVIAVWQKSLVPGMVLHTCVGLAALLQPA